MPSNNFRRIAYSLEAGDVIIALTTITHPLLSEPIRLSSDNTQRLAEFTTDADVVYGTYSRGFPYLFFPMLLTLPNDTDKGDSAVTLEFDNVTRKYTEAIRSITTPPIINVEIVLKSDPNVVELQWPNYLWTSVEYNADTIKGTLRMDLMEKDTFPTLYFNPSYFPGLFEKQEHR